MSACDVSLQWKLSEKLYLYTYEKGSQDLFIKNTFFMKKRYITFLERRKSVQVDVKIMGTTSSDL